MCGESDTLFLSANLLQALPQRPDIAQQILVITSQLLDDINQLERWLQVRPRR